MKIDARSNITLMIQGTASDAGKSTVVAGLCRAFKNRGRHVAPFKPQNMALNSAVTEDGGEIGRAQALQAIASGVRPHTDMNPVLIKPSSDTGAQIIVHGKVLESMDAARFHAYKPKALKAVLESHKRLTHHYDLVVVEGAGSPAEINLREGDIANMGFAEAVDCPVILVADIDKGGVFAQIVGTLELLSKSEQNRIIGFIINKFRGDLSLLESGLTWLEEKTGKPVFGVLPFLHGLYLDAEDAISTQQESDTSAKKLKVVVPVLPRISNHTDFDSLLLHPEVELIYADISATPPPCDLVILPGSKNVRQDLEHLRGNNWVSYIQQHLRYGGKLIGICGGYQMLGESINDPLGIEGPPGSSEGLGLIPMHTQLNRNKTLKSVSANLCLLQQTCPVQGYEIHNGISHFTEAVTHCIEPNEPQDHKSNTKVVSSEGYLSDDNRIMGHYLHGVFDTKEGGCLLLEWAGLVTQTLVDLNAVREAQIQRLENSILSHIDLDKLSQAAQIHGRTLT